MSNVPPKEEKKILSPTFSSWFVCVALSHETRIFKNLTVPSLFTAIPASSACSVISFSISIIVNAILEHTTNRVTTFQEHPANLIEMPSAFFDCTKKKKNVWMNHWYLQCCRVHLWSTILLASQKLTNPKTGEKKDGSRKRGESGRNALRWATSCVSVRDGEWFDVEWEITLSGRQTWTPVREKEKKNERRVKRRKRKEK